MIYFSPTVRALREQIEDLRGRLKESDAERRALLDRLLEKHRITPVAESSPASPAPALQFVAPPGVQFPEVQNVVRDVWIREEVDYLKNRLGYDEARAYAQAEASYQQQYGTH